MRHVLFGLNLLALLFHAGNASAQQEFRVDVPLTRDLGEEFERAPQGFDVLGVRIGMPFAAAEAKIRSELPAGADIKTIKTGFQLTSSDRVLAVSFQHAGRIEWAARNSEGTTETGAISFSPGATGSRVLSIERKVRAPANQTFELATLRNAIVNKYGQPSLSLTQYFPMDSTAALMHYAFKDGSQLPLSDRGNTQTPCRRLMESKYNFSNTPRELSSNFCHVNAEIYFSDPPTPQDQSRVATYTIRISGAQRIAIEHALVDSFLAAKMTETRSQVRELRPPKL